MGLLLVIGFIVVDIISILYRGIVLQVLWDWFMVTTFDLPSLSIPAALGISTVSQLLLGKRASSNDDETIVEMFIKVFVATTMALVVGFIINMFM